METTTTTTTTTTNVESGDGETESMSHTNELSSLQENFNQQQAKISALKELVRKSEVDQGKNTASAQEKVRNIAQRLTHLKSKATRSRQSEKSFSEIQEEACGESSSYEYESVQMQRTESMQLLPSTPLPQRARSETPGSEKIQLLRQQMEQNRLKMAERETSKRGIEQLVTQLKAKFDSSQLSLDRAHQFGSSVGDLSSLHGASAVQLKHQSTGDLSGAFSLDRERIKYLEKRVRHLETEVKQKEMDFLTKDPKSEHLKTIKTLEEKVMDLEENLKEKDDIIAARTQAASLITESLSLKGRDTVDLLEETKQEMYKMQSNFVAAEDDAKQQIAKMEKELQTKDKRIANLEEVNDILETARFDLTLKNSELDSKTGNVEDYVIKLNELNRINETLQHRIEELENEKETSGEQPSDASDAVENIVVHATVEQTLKLQALEARIAELQSENDDLKKSLQTAVNTPTTDESVQNKINALEATIEAQKAECLNLSNLLQLLQEQLQEKTVEYNVLMANFSALEEKLKSYGPKSLFSKSSSDETHAEVNKLSKQLDEANKAGIKTKLKMKQLQKQIDTFKKASDTNRELVKQSDEIQRLNEKIRELEAKLLVQSSRSITGGSVEEGDRRDTMASEKTSLPATELETKIKLLETTCQNQTSAIQLLEEQKLDMTADLNTTKTELSSLKGHISSIDKLEVTSQIDSIVLEEQFEENLREVEKLKQKINELMAEKADLKSRLDHYIAENMELMDKIEKLSKGSSVESIEILERLTHDERIEMERFQHQIPLPITEEDEHRGEDDVDKQRRDSAPAEAEIDVQAHSNDVNLEKIATLREENARYTNVIGELRAQKEIIANECEDLRASHLASLKQLNELQEDRQNLIENVNEINDIKAKLQTEIDLLTRERADVEERRRQRETSEQEAATSVDENTYKKCLTNLNAELDNYRLAKDKSTKANASKKLAREAKKMAESMEKLIVDNDRSLEMYESLKCEMEVTALARESQERDRLELMAGGFGAKQPDEDIEQLHDEINRYKEIESDLQQRCVELERQIEHEQFDKDELKRSLDELTEKSNEIESSLKDENDRLNRQLQEIESKLNDANEYTFQELQKQRKEFDNLMETNKKEVDILRELVEEQKQQLITAYTEHEDELQKKTQQIADYGAQIHRLQSALDETSEQMSKANDTYAAGLTEKVDSMKLLLDENQKILDEQTANLSHKQATIETLNQQIMDLYATMEHQSAELNEKEEEIVELQKTVDRNRVEMKKMNQNALAAERRAKEAETNAKKLVAEFGEAKTELETKNKEQLDKLKKFAANLKKRNAQYVELEQKYNQLEATKATVATEPVVVERKLESVALERSTEPIDELKKTIQQLESKMSEYETEVVQLRNDLNHRNAELENLMLRLSEKATLVEQLSLELDSRSVELNELRNKIAELPTAEDVKAKAVKIEKCKAIIKERNKEIKRLNELVETTTAAAASAAAVNDSSESLKLQLEQLQSEKEKAECDYVNYRTCIEAELQRNELVLETMEAENAQLKERIGRLEESICICEERRSSLERHSEVLGLQLEQKQTQIENAEDEYTIRLKALAGQDEIIEQKLNDLETERDNLAETVNELKTQQTELARRHSVLQTQLNDLESTKLCDLETENRVFGEKIERLEGELARQKTEFDQVLAAKHAELMELENELSDHLQKIEKERRSIQEDLEKSRDENETLQEEIGRLRDSQSDMERSRSDLEQQMTWIQQQNDTMTHDQMEAQELRMQVVQDQTEVEHLQVQNVEMAERHRQEMAQAEAEIDRLRRERDDLGREMDALKTQICQDQTKIVSLRCSVADHETEVNALQHRINELMAFSGQFEHDHVEIEALRANKQQLEQQLAGMRQQIAEMDSLQMHVGQNLTQDQMEVQQLRAQIGHDQTEIEALRHQLQTLHANHEIELTALRQQITELDSLRMQVGQNQTDDQVFIQNENERLQTLLAEKEIEIQNYQRQNLQLQMSAGAAAPNDPFAAISSSFVAPNDTRIAELESQLEAAIHEASDRRSKIAELEATIEDLQRSSNESDTNTRQSFAVPEMAIVAHQVEPLNAAASSVTASSFEQFESSQQIEDLQRNVSDLEKYVTDLEHKLKSATEENAKLHVRCKHYDDQLNALNVELAAVRERLSLAEAERQIVQTPVEVSVEAEPTESEPVQITAAMFFGGPAPYSSNPFENVGDIVDSGSQPIPVVEEVIVPKKAYICQPETLERQTLSPFSVEDSWGDTSWGADAVLEEEHQRQTVPMAEQSSSQVLSGVEVKLQMEIDQLTIDRDNLNTELTSMQSKYQKMLKKLREYKTKNDELERTKRASISSTVTESNDLDLAIQQELSDQIRALEIRLKETKAEHEKDADEKKKLLTRLDVLTAANDRMVEMKDRQDVEIEVCKTKIRELNGKLEKLNEWSDGTASVRPHDDGNGSEIALRLTEAQNQNRLLEERIARLQDSIDDKDDFEEEREQLLEKISTLTIEKKLLDEGIATKDEQIASLKSQLNAFESQNNDYRATIDILSVESNNIKTYLDRVKEEHKQKIDENSNLSEKLRELDSRNTELARQVEEMRVYNLNRQDVEQRIQDLTATIQYKESEIAELKESIENVRRQLQTEIEQLKVTVASRDDELRQLHEAREQYVAEKEVEETKEVVTPVAVCDHREFEKLIAELREEKQRMEEELQVLNDQVLKQLEIEDHIKSTVLESDMKNIELSELKNTIEQLRNQSTVDSSNDARITALEFQLSEKETLHQNAIDLLNVQWQQMVDQKCAEVADSWRHHLHTREEEYVAIEKDLREQLKQQNVVEPLPVATETQPSTIDEPSTTSGSNTNQSDLIKSMQEALESQEMEIVSLKEQLAIRSAEYARIAAAIDPYDQRLTSSHSLSGERVGSDENSGSSSQPNKGNELDLALYMLHQRDMRCEELTEEVIHLLQERDTLQLKLSNSIRQIEEIKRRTGIVSSDVLPNSDASSNDNSPVKPLDASDDDGTARAQTVDVGDNTTKKSPSSETLNIKLSELHHVNHSRDKTLYEDREQRHRQMSYLQRDVANMPHEAMAELFGPDYNANARNNSQNPSSMLLNWLWGKSDNDN